MLESYAGEFGNFSTFVKDHKLYLNDFVGPPSSWNRSPKIFSLAMIGSRLSFYRKTAKYPNSKCWARRAGRIFIWKQNDLKFKHIGHIKKHGHPSGIGPRASINSGDITSAVQLRDDFISRYALRIFTANGFICPVIHHRKDNEKWKEHNCGVDQHSPGQENRKQQYISGD